MNSSTKIYDITKGHPVHWHDDSQIFTAMASDMGFPVGEWPRIIKLKNPRTGNVVEFYKMFSKTNPQGELESYHYEAMTISSLANAFGAQDCKKDFSLTIFND